MIPLRSSDTVTLQVLQRALDASALRHTAISQNIANVDTPGYRALAVNFEQKLREALNRSSRLPLATSQERHVRAGRTDLSGINPELVRMERTSLRHDGNNVDIEMETTKLAENQLLYGTLSRLISDKFRLLQSVITEGKR